MLRIAICEDIKVEQQHPISHVKAFLATHKLLAEVLEDNVTLHKAVLGAATPEEAYTAAKEAVMGLTREEFLRWIQEISIKASPRSDESMDMATGGDPTAWFSYNPWQKNAIEWEDIFLHYKE